MPKTPLRYPGGKSRAVETIMPYIRDLDCGELCSPFLGGGSIELACAKEEIIVHGYDLFQPLVWFWEALLSTPQKLYKHVGAYRQQVRAYTDKTISTAQWHKKCSGKCLITLDHTEFCNHHKKLILIANNKMLGVSKKNFEMCRELANSRTAVTSQSKLFEAAAQYYIVNRTSFSGATTSLRLRALILKTLSLRTPRQHYIWTLLIVSMRATNQFWTKKASRLTRKHFMELMEIYTAALITWVFPVF